MLLLVCVCAGGVLRDQRAEENWALLLARHLAQEKGLPLAVCFNLVPRFSEATIRQYGWVGNSRHSMGVGMPHRTNDCSSCCINALCPRFMIRGLKETDAALSAKRIPLYLVRGEPQDTVPALATKLQAAAGETSRHQAHGTAICNHSRAAATAPRCRRRCGLSAAECWWCGVVLAVVTDLSPLRVPLAWVNQVATALEAQGGGTPLFQVGGQPASRPLGGWGCHGSAAAA